MAYVSGKVKKFGDSFGIVIPAKEAKKLNLKEGEVVDALIKKKGKIDGFGIFAGARPFKEEKNHDNLW
jgi:bifunctional DNA-binding transcriptional regulator/antitoxin component of YhaV-PrlF toxin-antitoxin module